MGEGSHTNIGNIKGIGTHSDQKLIQMQTHNESELFLTVSAPMLRATSTAALDLSTQLACLALDMISHIIHQLSRKTHRLRLETTVCVTKVTVFIAVQTRLSALVKTQWLNYGNI